MKRNEDLLREILFLVEKHPFDDGDDWINIWTDIHEHKNKQASSRYTNKEISYHVMLLHEAGFIKAVEINKDVWMPIRLTWDGHEFLEAARDTKRWNQVKDSMKSVGGFVFEIGKPLLIELIKTQVGLS